MLILIDPSAGGPIYEQIAGSIRAQVASGQLNPGDRLPSARDLAEQLDVNLHTILKAYQELRDEGTLDLRRGRGAVITDHAATLKTLADEVDNLARRARSIGVTGDALVSLVRARTTETPPPTDPARDLSR